MNMEKYVCIAMIDAFFVFMFFYFSLLLFLKRFKNKNINSYYIKKWILKHCF